jgi:hypothetical protein
MHPSILNAIYEYLVWHIKMDDEVDDFVVLL